jgi:hypothetical protein
MPGVDKRTFLANGNVESPLKQGMLGALGRAAVGITYRTTIMSGLIARADFTGSQMGVDVYWR